jgi:hypothetical protein
VSVVVNSNIGVAKAVVAQAIEILNLNEILDFICLFALATLREMPARKVKENLIALIRSEQLVPARYTHK